MTEDDEDTTLYLETYGYPQVDMMKNAVRITLGWFMPDLDEDEPAYYLDVYVDRDGQSTFEIDCIGTHFDIVTPLKDYGHYNQFGQWVPVVLETRKELLEAEAM